MWNFVPRHQTSATAKIQQNVGLFIFNRVQQLAGDAFTVMNDLFKEFTRIKSDVRRRFPHRIVNQLFERTQTFLANERRSLKIRRPTKLKVLLRKFQGHTFSSRQSNISVHLNQLDSFPGLTLVFHRIFTDFILTIASMILATTLTSVTL